MERRTEIIELTTGQIDAVVAAHLPGRAQGRRDRVRRAQRLGDQRFRAMGSLGSRP